MIDAKAFFYSLPPEKIAQFPLTPRSNSKLLVSKGNIISHYHFRDLPDLLDQDTLMIFNKTKVIQARLIFSKVTGAQIEVFCLEPFHKDGILTDGLNAKENATWVCMIGNKKRWKENEELSKTIVYDGKEITLSCFLNGSVNQDYLVDFSWNTRNSFKEILEIFGLTPLPPYISRDVSPEDKTTYQTVYANEEGAVAAPTAGLHFTPGLLKKIADRGISAAYITLHVGAGTFLPVKCKNIEDHRMHKERLVFTKEAIESLTKHNGKLLCVGTTCLRSLESLYWYGVLLKRGETKFSIEQTLPYSQGKNKLPDRQDVLEEILKYMNQQGLNSLHGQTSLFIYPGYSIRMCDILLTNFHQPNSTLLMLVAAFTGDFWKESYTEALRNDYRFLSYGDACLFFR